MMSPWERQYLLVFGPTLFSVQVLASSACPDCTLLIMSRSLTIGIDVPPVKNVRTCSGSLNCSGLSLSMVLINCLNTVGMGLTSLSADGGGERFRGFCKVNPDLLHQSARGEPLLETYALSLALATIPVVLLWSSSTRSGGSRHMKWNDLGHPSQHRNRPIPRHAEQKSWFGCCHQSV